MYHLFIDTYILLDERFIYGRSIFVVASETDKYMCYFTFINNDGIRNAIGRIVLYYTSIRIVGNIKCITVFLYKTINGCCILQAVYTYKIKILYIVRFKLFKFRQFVYAGRAPGGP